MKSTFFSSCLVLEPTSGTFSMARHSFQPRNSLFPCFSLYFPTLRALLREISPIIFSALPFLHCAKAFPIRAPLILHALHHLPIFHCFPFRSSFTLPFTSFPHLFFSFLPTFPSPSPINARTRAPSRITRVRVHTHTPTRQEVFVYCLHRFTHLPQSTVHQRVRGEAKREKAFTKYTTASQSEH